MVKKGGATNTLNIIAIILGGISVIFSFFAPYIVMITGILGVIFAYVKKGKGHEKSNAWAFVLNVIGLFLALLMLTLSIITVIMQNLGAGGAVA